ncbi:MAG: hypothetical protein H7Z73_06555, partial [Candidatus Saccharibacteria bacterium]|nr:hypothetical protein [Moraxellaceae bacterium]
MFNQLSQYTRYRYSLTVGTIVIALSGSIVHAALPGDLTIYRKGTAGKVTLVMMLDNSGSMASGSLNEDYGLASNCTLSNDTATTSAPSYVPKYCPVTRSTYSALSAADQVHVTNGCIATGNTATATSTVIYKCFTRIYRVQAGMYAALDDATVSDDAVMGVGTFNNTRSGKILYPAAALRPVVTNGTGTTGQRYLLKNAINSAFAGGTTIGATPTAPAYAEAAAYMLGTTTANNISLTYRKDVYRRINTIVGAYNMCSTLNSAPTLNVASNGAVSVNNQTCSTWSSTTTTTQYANSGATAYDGTYTQTISNISYIIYYKNTVGSFADPDSGFANSIASSKSGSSYISPLPATADRASCNGQGIYFLTDGEPNGPANDQFNVMKAALGSSGSTFSCATSPITPASPILSNTGATNTYPAWDCIGTFSNALYGNTTTRANGTKFGDGATNPQYSSTATVPGASIQTALVGFGAVFENLNNTDPSNACDWGARAGGAGSELNCSTSYGGGGFYQAGSAADVTRSIKKFLEDLIQTDITPLVTGAAAVPVDGVDPNSFQPYAYMRVLTPDPASTSALIWEGNLKKYNVASGTLKSASPLATILNDDGTFVMDTSSTPAVASTTDLWNSTGVADGGITLKGGAFSKVRMPTSGVSPRTLRPLWTNYNSSGNGELSPSFSSSCTSAVPYSCGSGMLRIPAAPSAAGETWIDSYITTKFNATPLSNIAMSTRLTLLNYLGYVQPLSPLPSTVPALSAPTVKANFATGGIIHSLPVQVTYSANINSDGTLADARTSSVLYGTMEGALHLVAAGNASGSTSTDTSGGVEQ